jgi:hypothetical protein
MLESLVASLEQAMKESALAPKLRSPVGRPDNPVYLQVKAQLDTLQIEKAQLDQERRYLRSRLDDFERRVAQSPEVERQYVTLTRDYESAYRKYQEVRAKQLEAQASMNLETERKGERFTLIEPPLPSESPVSPRRGLILGLGLALSLLVGIGAGVAAGLADPRVRGAVDLTRLLEVPPLAQLPVMVTADDRRRLDRRLRWWLTGAGLSVVTAALLAHLLWRPLDLVWLQVLRRFGA